MRERDFLSAFKRCISLAQQQRGAEPLKSRAISRKFVAG